MAEETILQHYIFTKFIFPFLLIFFIVFAILEKTKALGENKQINALVAFVIGVTFIGFAYPKEVVSNLILFLTVSLVIVFVVLLLWGFATGGEAKVWDKVKWLVAFVIVIAVVIAVLQITGYSDELFNFFFDQAWSSTFWINVSFVVAIAGALALVLRSKSG